MERIEHRLLGVRIRRWLVAALAAQAGGRVVAWESAEWWTVGLSLFELLVLAFAFRNPARRSSEGAGDASGAGPELARPA